VWILRGSGTYADDQGHTVSLAAGDAFLRWPGRRHTTRLVPDSGWYEFYLNLGDELPLLLEQLGVLDSRRTVWRLGLDAARLGRWLAFRSALDRAGEQDLPALCVQAQGLVVEALGTATRPADPVAAACAYLGEHLAEREDLRSFCRQQGLDYETFRKRFRREVGCSPSHYRIHRRLDRACALLNGTTWPVARIAAELGYASAFDFSAQFRRHLGLAPRTYRARQS
jgi:AraC-like DNA-binding protein